MSINLPRREAAIVSGIFVSLLVIYHLIFRDYFPLPSGKMGHDYVLTLGTFLDGYLWYKNNGFITPPWFSPSFCGGQAFFADPQSAFYSIPQFLTFITDPLQAVYWSFLTFAGLGFLAMYLYARKSLHLDYISATIAASVFMFNGFYSHRMIIGHYGYQAFMLIPLVAYLLTKPRRAAGTWLSDAWPTLLSAILIAYWFHSGLTTLIIPAALTVLGLACIVQLYSSENVITGFLLRGSVAGLISIGLCASKLNANLTLMSLFSRDYYPLPGLANSSEILGFVFQAIFYSSEHTYQWVTPLWKNMQWSAMPHELAYGLTPIALGIIVIGFGSSIKLGNGDLPSINHKLKNLIRYWPIVPLCFILWIPLALLYYSPEWNSILKRTPLIGSTTSPFRWLSIFVIFASVLTGLAAQKSKKIQFPLLAISALGIPTLNALENRDFYQDQNYDPRPVVQYYKKISAGEISPRITKISESKNKDDVPLIDNSAFLRGESSLYCYNPLFGYRLEKLVTFPLHPGNVEDRAITDGLNLRNPACLVFPKENNCKPWDAFSTTQIDDLNKFSNYYHFNFERSTAQKISDWTNTITLILIIALLLLSAFESLKSKKHNIMKNLIKNFFSKSKKSNELVSNAPKEINYFTLLNYIYPLSKKISTQELQVFLNAEEISSQIDKSTHDRLTAFHHFFIENWQDAYNYALPLATTPPFDQDMVGLLATIWNNSGKFKNALAVIKEYSDESRIDNKEAYLTTRGTTAWCAGETEEALLYLERAMNLNPQSREALSTLAGIYAELGEPNKSSSFRQQLLSLYSEVTDVNFYEGMYKIGEEYFDEGWALYEKRYESSVAPKYFDSNLLTKTRWDGSSLNGKTLFLYFEQGLGDTLMSCRFINELKNLGGKIIAECQPEVTDILQLNFPGIDFIYRTANPKIDIKFDYWIGSMSLPHLLRIDNFSPPHREGYLTPPAEYTTTESLLGESKKPKIGISWSGNPAHTNDARRSIPWETIKQVIEKSDLEFYAIQTFIPEGKPCNLIDLSDHLITLSDTAQLIAKLDLIITVDTSLVHLAGALGKNTWLLCNKTPEWRWGNDCGETRWYKSVKLLKNENYDDWNSSLEKIILSELPIYFKEIA